MLVTLVQPQWGQVHCIDWTNKFGGSEPSKLPPCQNQRPWHFFVSKNTWRWYQTSSSKFIFIFETKENRQKLRVEIGNLHLLLLKALLPWLLMSLCHLYIRTPFYSWDQSEEIKSKNNLHLLLLKELLPILQMYCYTFSTFSSPSCSLPSTTGTIFYSLYPNLMHNAMLKGMEWGHNIH